MRVFISYARENLAFAQRLADDLSEYDLQLWMDVRSIPHGANWDYEVQKGLDSSDVMLVLLSAASVMSQNVADEWSYFIEKDKPIIPLLIEACDVPFRLSRRQRVDFRENYRTALYELLRAMGSPQPLDPASTAISFAPTQAVAKPSPERATRSGAEPTRSTPRPAATPALPEIGVRMFPAVWGEKYHWFNGMRGTGTAGDLLINDREIALIPRMQPIITIPLKNITSVKMHRSIDYYLRITFYGTDGAFRTLLIMGAPADRRKSINEDIVNTLNYRTGRNW